MQRRFLRVAQPIGLWDGPPAEIAKQLAAEAGWSLFLRVDHLEARDVLAAFYGWREGNGPAHDPGYLIFEESELRLTNGSLTRTPQNYVHGWPPEIREAHYDLEGHTLPGCIEFARVITAGANRLQTVERVAVLASIYAMSRRADAPDKFKERTSKRFSKLLERDPALMAEVRERAGPASP